MNCFSTKQFSYDNKTFRAEISDLLKGGQFSVFGLIYDDACDEGLTLVSHKTGKEAKFVVDYIHKDPEKDIMWWTLVPTRDTVRHLPSLCNTRVVIYND